MDFTSKSAAALYFRKKIRKDLQTVSLNADMIRLLLAIDERKSLYQIAVEVEMDAAAFWSRGSSRPCRKPSPGWTVAFCRRSG